MPTTNDKKSDNFDWNNFLTKFFYSDVIDIINETTGLHFFNDGSSVFLIRNDDKLYGFGKRHLCLNSSAKEDTIVPALIEGINNLGINSLCTGNEHAVLLDNNGEVFCWGNNKYGQIGCGADSTKTTPYKLSLPKMTQISCGRNFTLALSCAHEVWLWGKLNSVQDNTPINWLPSKITLPGNVKLISAGWSHATVMNDEEKVYTWGNGSLGTPTQDTKYPKNVEEPTEIRVPNKVLFFLANADHNLLVTKTNEWYYSNKTTTAINQVDLSPMLTREIYGIASLAHPFTGIISKAGVGYEIHFFCKDDGTIRITVTTRTDKYDIYRMFRDTPTLHICQPSSHFTCTRIMPNIRYKAPYINISDLFNVNNCSDLIITFKNDQIFVHKLILIKRSSYFKKLFENNTKSKLNELDESNWRPEPYKAYIKYLYSDILDVQIDYLPEVYLLGDRDENYRLKTLCMDNYSKGMTKQNIIELYHAAFVQKVKVMMDACGAILLQHLPELLDSELINNIPVDIKVALLTTAALQGRK